MGPLLDTTLVGESFSPASIGAREDRVLLLGVGNLLMGDEGVGVHVLRALERQPALAGVRMLDGGTGGVYLLLEFGDATDIILVDATRDGLPAGTIAYQQPKRLGEIPRGLSAHDFGLKDLFAAAALLGRLPNLHLYTVSVEELRPMTMELGPAVASAAEVLTCVVYAHAAMLAASEPEFSHAN